MSNGIQSSESRGDNDRKGYSPASAGVRVRVQASACASESWTSELRVLGQLVPPSEIGGTTALFLIISLNCATYWATKCTLSQNRYHGRH